MGGWGSGRQGGTPTVEAGLTIDLALLLRRGWIKDRHASAGQLTWKSDGEQIATISHNYCLLYPDDAWLKLQYRNKRSGEWVSREQRIRLSFTEPNFGGRRWWMHCPVSGKRVGKLHLPPGGDIFASREAWRLGYRIQRVAKHDRIFEQLFRLQRKLGCDAGWEAGLYRPKGMHRKTFDRHLARYCELEEGCDAVMAPVLALMRKLDRTH